MNKGIYITAIVAVLMLASAIGFLAYHQGSFSLSEQRNLNADGLNRTSLDLDALDVRTQTGSDISKIKILDDKSSGVLVAAELKTDLKNYVGVGYQTVFEIEINNTIPDIPFGRLIYGMELYKNNKDGAATTKQIDYYKVTVTGYNTIIDYTSECSVQNVNHNGTVTKEEVCIKVESGSHQQPIYGEELLNVNSLISEDIITIKAKTNVEIGETVEWVPSFLDEAGRVPQWAIWTNALTDGLKAYFTFNESALPMIDSAPEGLRDITVEIETPEYGQAGGANDSYVNFDPTSNPEAVLISSFNNSGEDIGDNWSVSGWYNNTLGDAQAFGTKEGNNWEIGWNGASDFFFFDGQGGLIECSSFGGLPTNTWVHFALTSNMSGTFMYSRGNLCGSSAVTLFPQKDIEIWIGCRTNDGVSCTTNDVEGGIDELAFWNRTLTPSEILILNESITIAPKIDFDIAVTLLDPPNNTAINTGTIQLNASIDPTLGNSTNHTFELFHINGSIRNFTTTMQEIAVDTNVSQTFFNLPDGEFLWNVRAEGDNPSQVVKRASENRTFAVDSTPPQLNLTAPLAIIDYHRSGRNLTISWVVNDTIALDSCVVEYNLVNFTVDCNLNTSSFNVTEALPATAIFYVNDTGANSISNTISWSYDVFENSRVFNDSDGGATEVYETDSESYIINITYNNTLYTTINPTFTYKSVNRSISTSGVAPEVIVTSTFDTPLGNVTNFFNWTFALTNSTITKNVITETGEQGVGLINFTEVCQAGAPDNVPFLNFTFTNETAGLEDVEASIPSSTFTYAIESSSGSINKTLTFISTNEETNYTFCFSPSSKRIDYTTSLDYTNAISQQRTFTVLSGILSSAILNQQLFLLPTSEGIFTRYKAEDQVGNVISAVLAVVSRTISGTPIQVSSDTTDDSGLVSFFLNPDFTYDYVFSKTGHVTNRFSIKPNSPDTYTILMPTVIAVNVSGTLLSFNLTYEVLPTNLSLANQTTFNFGINVTTSQDISLVTFNLTNQTGEEVAFASSTSTGFTSVSFNTAENTRLIGRFIITVGNESITGNKVWVIGNDFVGDYSIFRQFTLFNDYEFSNFIRAMILLAILSGVMVYLSRAEILPSDESKVLVIMLLIWAFSIVEWLDTGFAIPGNSLSQLGSQYGIAILTSAAAFYFVGRRLFIRRP